MNEVIKLTGWSENLVKDIFAHDKDFPAIKRGKRNQVELSALKKYLSERRVSR